MPHKVHALCRVLFERLPPETRRQAHERMLAHYCEVLALTGKAYREGDRLKARLTWRKEEAVFRLIVREAPLPRTLLALFVEAGWMAEALLREMISLPDQRAFFGRCLEAAKDQMELQVAEEAAAKAAKKAPSSELRLLMELREGQLLGVLAAMAERAGELPQSVALAKESLECLLEATPDVEREPDAWRSMDTMGQSLVLQGDVREGVKVINKAAFLKKRVLGGADGDVADRMFSDAAMLFGAARRVGLADAERAACAAEAMGMYDRCLEIRVREADGEHSVGVAAVLMNMAIVEKFRGSLFASLALYERFMGIKDRLGFATDQITQTERTRLLKGYTTMLT